MHRRRVAAVVACLLWGCGSEQSAGRLASTGDGQGEIVVPAGMMIDGLTLVQSPEPFLDVMFAPVGPGYLCGPSGQQFSKKVTLRLPVTADLLAQYEKGPDQVHIYTRAAGESRFHPLATRGDSTGLKVEADVSHFSEFQVGVAVPHECLGQADQADCRVYVCQLAGFIAEQEVPESIPDDEEGTLSPAASLIVKAEDACTKAMASDPAGALETLAALEAELLTYLNASLIDSFTYQEILELVQDAQAALQRIPGLDPTGTWVGTLPIGGDDRPFAVQLHRRKDGTLMGYVLGGTRAWTVAGGWQGGDRIHFALELNPLGLPRHFTVDGTVNAPSDSNCAPGTKCTEGNYFLGTVEEGEEVHNILWTQTSQRLEEQRYVLWDPGTNDSLLEVALAVGQEGNLVSGSYASKNCSAENECAGQVFGVVHPDGDSNHLRLLLDSYGNRGASIDLVNSEASSADGPGYYIAQGEWQSVAPDGDPAGQAPSGPLLGGRLMGTTSQHVAKMLATYGNLADDLAARKDFLYYVSHPGHPSFSPSYNHFGRTKDDLMVELASEATAFERITVDFSRFAGLATIAQERTLPVGTAIGVDFHDRRTGYDAGRKVVYRDATTLPPYDRYRFLAFEGQADDLLIAGNQMAADTFGLFLKPEDLSAFGLGIAKVESPFGVHRNESPLGTQGISVRFLQDPIRDVVVAASSQAIFAGGDGAGPTTCPQDTRVAVQTQAGVYSLRYEGTTGCAWSWAEPLATVNPNGPDGGKVGTTIPSEDSQVSQALRFQAGIDLTKSFCPYWLLSEEARGQMLQAAQSMSYPEQLTEPFLCNPKQGESQVFPISLTWTRTTNNNPANPAKIRFTRNGLSDQVPYAYEALDAAGQVVSQGAVTYLETEGSGPDGYRSIGLNPYNGEGAQGWLKVRPLSATSSVMSLDVVGGQVVDADEYNGSIDGIAGGMGENCDDGNPCTDDLLTDPSHCVHLPSRSICDDANACTERDRCEDGECRGSKGDLCDDGDPCTDDGCNPTEGCVFSPLTGPPCQDSDPCTTGDYCYQGVCVGGINTECVPSGQCYYDREGCRWTSLDPMCPTIAVPTGVYCDDGVSCTVRDTCDGLGACVGDLDDSVCNDGVSSTHDYCTPSGCEFQLLEEDLGSDFQATVTASGMEGTLPDDRMASWQKLYRTVRTELQPVSPEFYITWDRVERTPVRVGNILLPTRSFDLTTAHLEALTRIGEDLFSLFGISIDDEFGSTEVYRTSVDVDETLPPSGYRVVLRSRTRHGYPVADDYLSFAYTIDPGLNPDGLLLISVNGQIHDVDYATCPDESRRLSVEEARLLLEAQLPAYPLLECSNRLLFRELVDGFACCYEFYCDVRGNGDHYRFYVDVVTGDIRETEHMEWSSALASPISLPHDRTDGTKAIVGVPAVVIREGGDTVGVTAWDGTVEWSQALEASETPVFDLRTEDGTEDQSTVNDRSWQFDWRAAVDVLPDCDPNETPAASYANENELNRRVEAHYYLHAAQVTMFEQLNWPRFSYDWAIMNQHPNWGETRCTSARNQSAADLSSHHYKIWLYTQGAPNGCLTDSTRNNLSEAYCRYLISHEFGHSLHDAVRGFKRMNSQGKPLFLTSLPTCDIPFRDDSCTEASWAIWFGNYINGFDFVPGYADPGTLWRWPDNYYPIRNTPNAGYPWNGGSSEYTSFSAVFLNMLNDDIFRRGPNGLVALRDVMASFATTDTIHMRCSDPTNIVTCDSTAASGKYTLFRRFLDAEDTFGSSSQALYEISKMFHDRVSDADPGEYSPGNGPWGPVSVWSDYEPSQRESVDPFPWADDATNSPQLGGDLLSIDECMGADCGTLHEDPVGLSWNTPPGMMLTLGSRLDQDVFSFVGRYGQSYLPRVKFDGAIYAASVQVVNRRGVPVWTPADADGSFWPSKTDVYRLVVRPKGLLAPAGPGVTYSVGISKLNSPNYYNGHPSGAVPLSVNGETRTWRANGRRWHYFVVPQDGTMATLAVRAVGQEFGLQGWLLRASSVYSDELIDLDASLLATDEAGGLDLQQEGDELVAQLPLSGPLSSGVYFLALRTESEWQEGNNADEYTIALSLQSPTGEVSDVGNDASQALDLDRLIGGEFTFKFPTYLASGTFEERVAEVSDVIDNYDEDYYSFLARPGQVVQAWVDRINCDRWHPESKVHLQWVLGDRSVGDVLFSDRGDLLWYQPPDPRHDVPKDDGTIPSFVEIARDDNPILSETSFPMAVPHASLAFILPSGPIDSTLVQNWERIWLRVRMDGLGEKCTYVLGVTTHDSMQKFPTVRPGMW